VINLDSREDRLGQAMGQSSAFPEGLIRIPAIKSADISSTDIVFVPPGVIATWKSHQQAYSFFLENSSDSHCLILEDDFIIENLAKFHNYLDLSKDFDFLQLGFLTPHLSDRAYRFVWNLQNFFLRGTVLFRTLPIARRLSLFSRRSLVDVLDTPQETVLHDVHAGGHAYVVSRSFASRALLINNPVFLSADGVFMAIAKSRAFKMGRARKSVVSQSNSPSSVDIRFLK
jgi:sulfur transfer complex TusBCD TusB component (DsrH family)